MTFLLNPLPDLAVDVDGDEVGFGRSDHRSRKRLDEFVRADGLRGFLGLGILLKLVAELRDEALGRPRASFAEGADRTARNLVGDALEERGIFVAGLTVDHARGDFLHPQ